MKKIIKNNNLILVYIYPKIKKKEKTKLKGRIDLTVDEKDKKLFLEDFKKADIKKKLDMWYYAIEQEAIWEEILDEMSSIAQAANPKQRITEEE
ncbi:MAG: hypothetical protein QXS02_05665 [Candidatus Thermoplasmatota archaeon]